MPLVVPPGFAHVAYELRHSDDPDPWYVTVGIDSSAYAGDIEQLGVDLANRFWGHWDVTYNAEVSLTGVQLTIGQDGADEVRAFIPPEEPKVGTSTAQKLPQNCAMLIRKNTALGGRRNRGRMFMPGMLDEGQVSPVGIIDSTYLTGQQSRAADWLSTFNDDGGPEVLLTPMHILHSTGNTAVPDPTPVTFLTVDGTISTQRRRLR